MLSKDFKEFIELLNKNKVRYLVVGGYALAFHGHPRYTKDIDILMDSSLENSDRLLAVLDQFGFSSLGLKTEDFTEPGQIIQLGYPPNRIDLLTGIVGLNFDELYGRRETVEIEGMNVDFIDREGLKASKRIAGRLQDLADIDNLKGD